MVKSKALTKKTWKMFSINKPYTENLPIQPSLKVQHVSWREKNRIRKEKKKNDRRLWHFSQRKNKNVICSISTLFGPIGLIFHSWR